MFEKFFSISAIPHGYCLSWQSGLLWLHVVSNALIALAYIGIPATIYLFIRRKHQHLMHQNLFWLFAFFIIACAMTHLMGIVVIWQPYYLLQGLIMAITALISLVTAVELGRQIPTLLKMPTVAELQTANQKLAEQIAHSQALEKKLRLTQFAVENVGECIFWVRADASIFYANIAAMESLGYEQAELLNLTILDLDPVLNREMWTTLWQESKIKKNLSFETEVLKKDHSLLSVEVNISFIEYEGEEYHCSFMRNISERKKTEQAIKSSELMLRQAQKIAHVGHWIYELKTHNLYWSDEIYRIFGLQPQQSKPVYQEFIHPDDKAFVHQAYSNHLNQQADYDVQYRLLLKNGMVKYVNAKARLEVDSQGQPQRSVGVMFDITEQKQAEQRVKDLLDLNQKIISQSAAGVEVFNASGHCISCNEAAARILDKTIDQLLQENFYSLPLWQTTQLVDTALKCLAEKQPQRQEIQTTLPSGKHIWLDYNFAPISSNHENHLLVLIHNVTEYRLAEIVQQQAKLSAEQGSQAKSNFIANMSHEIRTPMNAVIGMSYLMLNTPLDRQQQDLMKKIQRSSEHLMAIISDILDFSKIEADKLELEVAEFSLEKLLDEVIALMFAKATGKSLELILKVDSEIPCSLLGDPMRLNQILVNYVDNAIKFSQNGPVLIEVQLKQDYEQDVLLYFAVHDKGIGLTEAQQDLLFKSFQQIDVSSTRKYGGTGIGLVLAKKLAELMGGEVGVVSEYGQGSTFWFTARLGKTTTPKTRSATVAALPPANLNTEQQVPQLLAEEAMLETDQQAVAGILCQLVHLLEECDSDAVEMVETNRALLKAVFAENYPLFYTLIENFDFDAATGILKQVAANRQVNLT